MGLFSIRVELHDAIWPTDYQALHNAMKQKGFVNTIQDSLTGIVYNLPTAEYNVEGNFAVDDVTQSAIEAASAVSKRYAVFVTQGIQRRWIGLE